MSSYQTLDGTILASVAKKYRKRISTQRRRILSVASQKKDQNLSAYFGADEDLSAFLPGLTRIVKTVVKTPFKQAKAVGKLLISPVVGIGKAVKFAAVGSKTLQMPKPSATSSSVTTKQTATSEPSIITPRINGVEQAMSNVVMPGEVSYTSPSKSTGVSVIPPPQTDEQALQPQYGGTEPGKSKLSPVVIIAAIGALAVGGYMLSKKSKKPSGSAIGV